MICTKRTQAIELDRCRNVEVVGLTIDYDPLTFTQGTVTSVAPDKSFIDVKIDAGYPRMPYTRIDVVDPSTRFRRHGIPFLWGTRAEMVRPDMVRITRKDIAEAVPAGSLVSLNEGNEAGGICHGIDLENGWGGMILHDVTLYCAPGMGIVEHAGDGGTQLLHVRIVPGPPPVGATQPRLLTTFWDGIAHTAVRHGPDVERCTIEKCGDDSWSVQSSPLLVLKAEAGENVLAGSIDLRSGDHLRRALDSPAWTIRTARRVPLAQAALSASTLDRLEKAAPWTLWSVDHETVQIVTLEPGAPNERRATRELEAGTSVYSPENQGAGFIFCDNHTHSSGRVLIKASNGLVEGNTLIDGHNIVVMPEVSAEGAFGITNLTFRNNRIVGAENFNAMPWSLQAGGLCIASEAGRPGGEPAAVKLSNITIADNIFEDISAANIFICGARGVTLTGNRFLRPDCHPLSDSGARFGVNHAAVIVVRNCDGARIAGNTIAAPGSRERQTIDLDASDTHVTGAKAGIVVTNGPN